MNAPAKQKGASKRRYVFLWLLFLYLKKYPQKSYRLFQNKA
jgi:hypothetical protein